MASGLSMDSTTHGLKDTRLWTVSEVKDWAKEHYGDEIAGKLQGILCITCSLT